MTKHHFIELAKAIKDHDDRDFRDMFSREQLETLANFLGKQNPKFNRIKWLDYIDGVTPKQRRIKNGMAMD